MKLPSIILRYGLGLAAGLALASLSACTAVQTRAPGPHQGSGVVDGKDGSVTALGTGSGDPTDGIQLSAPGPHQLPAGIYRVSKDDHSATLRIPVYATGDDHSAAGGNRHKHKNYVTFVIRPRQGDPRHVHADTPAVEDND